MSNPEPLQALLLAGTRAGEADSVARAAGVPCKALAPVAGRPMIEHSLATLLDSPGIGRIEVAMRARETIAADAPGLAGWLEREEVQLIEPQVSPARTVAAALDRLPAGAPLLVTTADHALLSAAMLEQ
ncbi:MAG TPA: NTP transferase domain-containing protein, partial [Arenicellales bacterium]|nr:NTP transferase domain-containing protein [Arenicellales bacterium]